MKELKQLYTDIFRGSYVSSRKLIFIAEGYRTVDESIFYKDVYDLLKSLETIFPFSILKGKGNKSMFSVLLSFSPSAQSGYATSQSQAVGRTIFESYFSNGKLNLNYNKLNAYIDELVYPLQSNEGSVFLKEGLVKGLNRSIDGIVTCPSSTLIFIILPKANRSDIELEVDDENAYYSIVTSMDTLCEQVVLKAIGKMLSLGDEFDLASSSFLKPNEIQGPDRADLTSFSSAETSSAIRALDF